MAEIHCRHFNGYKPCGKNLECDRSKCASFQSIGARVLIVHLEALGAVLRSTALLAAIRRKYKRAHITWVTKSPAQALLQNLVSVDRVLTTSPQDLLKLSALTFDVALVIDKSLEAAGVLKSTNAQEIFGFKADPVVGAIVPANSEAIELWELGLSDEKKFFKNKKSEQQLVHEALRLGPFTRDPYQIQLSEAERDLSQERRQRWVGPSGVLLGLNTGSSAVLPFKKLSVEGHRRLIEGLLGDERFAGVGLVLLGGPEDTERNEAIVRGLPVKVSPTELGLRDGLASVEACDLVFSGDSLGMHMAIALQKWVVAWFGPTCPQEIDLYDRGVKVISSATCSPCWKRVCEQKVMCYDQVDFKQVNQALAQGLTWLTSSSKQLFPETSFSPFL